MSPLSASVLPTPAAGPGLVSPAALSSIGPSDALAWIAIGAFAAAFAIRWRGRPALARYVGAGAWATFGVFWTTMVPYYYAGAQSPIKTILALAALPLCLYTGYLLARGRESLFVLSKAVAIMGLVYLPVETIPFVRTWLIETTAAQTHAGMELLGHAPGLNEGANGYESRFNFDSDETATGRTTYIVLACTGIGSMSIFGGLIAAVRAPLARKVAGAVLAVGVIWILNLVRNVFVGLATPHGWFQQDLLVHLTTTYAGAVPERTSFLVAHNYISQPLSIVALIGITYAVVRIVPEVLEPLEEALFVLTGTEYDLADALAVDARPSEGVRADGGDR